ncbi:hypothetical protein DEJ23_08790 [Curtobacterium sp. MCSS17_008]|uniref:hypothetical protein n=1 Tax=Curtobacterium sp. MCSS17_008 TaxID=2175647 RepID=UPI000DA8A16F|nr:hypothetical protein [Curtobacterium sp. MCSS17_008]PZF57027.1 hypothetical protein DEJ23_08790 [Curtobacterium sp. MCSS17_008]
MDWWNDLTDWTASDEGWRVLSGAIIPFVAIVVAGVIAALIGRAAAKRVVALHDRESRNAAVAGVVSAARKATRWGALGHEERAYADHVAEDADIRLRMLPVSGATLAADWAQHEIADIKRNSSTFTSQADQSLGEFRDRLLEWQARPNRARKLFKADLERWKFDSPDPDAELIARQQDWNAGHQEQRTTDGGGAAQASRPTPTTTSLRSAPQANQQAGAPQANQHLGAPQASNPQAGAPQTNRAAWAGDRDATTPINDVRPAADNRTRPYGEGETVPIDGTPVRPQLGTPLASSRQGTATATSTRNDVGGPDADDARAVDATDQGRSDERSEPRPASAPRIASPTSADAHVNRSSATASGLDRQGPTTGAPGASDDIHDEDASPYTQPISASELRRRSADDD